MASDGSGASRGRRGAAKRAAPRTASSARDRALDRWLGSPWMALPVFGLALAVRLIHLDQMTGSTTPLQPAPAELDTLAVLGLGHLDPARLRLAGVVLSSLTAVVVQRLGLSLVGPATGLYAGLWMALWWPAVALAPLLVPATALALALAAALAGLAAAFGSKRPYWVPVAGVGAGTAMTLEAATVVLVPIGWLVFALHRKWKRSTKVVATALFLVGVGLAVAGLNALRPAGGPPFALGLAVAARGAEVTDAAVRSPEEIADDPWRFVAALGGRAARLAAWSEPPGRVDIAPLRVRSWALRLPFPAWEFALPLALLGIVLALRARKEGGAPRLVALTALLLLALSLRAPVTAETRLALVPALIPMAVYGVGAAWGRVRAAGLRRPGRRKDRTR
jgi:hypothetical protein